MGNLLALEVRTGTEDSGSVIRHFYDDAGRLRFVDATTKHYGGAVVRQSFAFAVDGTQVHGRLTSAGRVSGTPSAVTRAALCRDGTTCSLGCEGD
jgi:hypothetical protein